MSEAWDLLAWWGTPTSEEARLQREGRAQVPTVLAFGVTLTDTELRAEIVTVTRKLRRGPKTVTLYRGDSSDPERTTVRVDWDDCLKPARWGDATFRLA